MSKDPICGMKVDENTALTVQKDGQTFYFCSTHCQQKFLGDPIGQKSCRDEVSVHQKCHQSNKTEQLRHAGKVYTCPM
ncbi:MAG: YHS domain-containing protein, partial [Taibaiella sp.]|nr:YHS domain-containing protein [Taibaiella sp.]